MRQRRALLASAALAVILTTGCGSGGSATSGAAPTAAAPAGTGTTPAAPVSPAPVSSAPAGPATTSAGAGAGELPDGYDPNRDAAADLKAALALSAGDQRPVLIDFGANWCPDCKVLDKLFHSAEVAPMLRGDYRVVAVDVGKFDHNLDLAAQYVDLQQSGIPALVVLAPDGSVRTASNDGAFSNARSMNADTVAAYLKRWSQK
ncbi:thioredoxin family protein [Streptomyces kaniharaensis]|uniref:Thioredoxin family protein n=1 Tax=Streptomyces kaniharaensis TaxID=212423 RepID=A0A6N7L1C6_9ACTN|nr:thioredoxin family protein [Streptomyces kaniharaensis]MQS16497.1 thioredoxin family protein [Streptomyces kaniharaensis]